MFKVNTLLRRHDDAIPRTIRLLKQPKKTHNADPNLLGVAGGPSAWFQAFRHLKQDDKNSVVFFRPPGAPAIWQSSGRQISCREKVTKFIRPSVPIKSFKNYHTISFQNIGRLAKCGYTFLKDRVSDAPHDKVVKDISESLTVYREINELCLKNGEAPIWKETGRLVIAGEKEYHSLYRNVLAWREKKGLVSSESSAKFLPKSADASRHCLTVKQSERYLKECSLFNSGYQGYPLDQGGYVVRNADEILFRSFEKEFGKKRFSIVEAEVETCFWHGDQAVEEGGGYTLKTRPEQMSSFQSDYEYPLGKFYLSAGEAPVVVEILREEARVVEMRKRLAPPIEITGHSGIILQRLSKKRAEAILQNNGKDGKKSYADFDDFFETDHPAAVMTDDFELTFESSARNEKTGDYTIRWRCTGNAHINTRVCRADPMKTLFDPVKRFLSGDLSVEPLRKKQPGSQEVQKDGNTKLSYSHKEPGCAGAAGFKNCIRQVGPTIREEILPFGANGTVALNWGHMGVTLAGIQM